MSECTCDPMQLELAAAVGAPEPHSYKCPTLTTETPSEAFALNDDAAISRALGMPLNEGTF